MLEKVLWTISVFALGFVVGWFNCFLGFNEDFNKRSNAHLDALEESERALRSSFAEFATDCRAIIKRSGSVKIEMKILKGGKD